MFSSPREDLDSTIQTAILHSKLTRLFLNHPSTPSPAHDHNGHPQRVPDNIQLTHLHSNPQGSLPLRGDPPKRRWLHPFNPSQPESHKHSYQRIRIYPRIPDMSHKLPSLLSAQEDWGYVASFLSHRVGCVSEWDGEVSCSAGDASLFEL